jgi:hypothetical protein
LSNTPYNICVVYKIRYEPVRYVDQGMTVWARYERFCPPEERETVRAKGTAVRCTVAVAAGHHARIVNDRLGIDAWSHIDDLFLPVTPAAEAREPSPVLEGEG